MTDNDVTEYISKFKCVHWNKLPNEISNYLENRFDDSLSYKESFYRILNNIEHCPTCKVCGKKLTFNGFLSKKNSFGIYCSQKCRNNKKLLLEKSKYNITKTINTEYDKYL